jgi:hypothetical protein
MTYYNTNHETGATLKRSEAKADSQEWVIINYFNINGGKITACNLHQYLLEHGELHFKTPLTSTRRALTNLMKQGKVMKGEMAQGRFGKMVHTWKLAKTETQTQLFL